MNPVDLSSMAQHLGPGTGGLWMGEQQRNAMQESEIGQAKSLEEIARSQQARDIASQKLPLELQQMRDTNAMAPGKLEELGLKNTETKNKLDRQKVVDFTNDILGYQGVDNPLDNAFQLQALAKKHGLDGDDPRIRSMMMNSMDKAGIKKMQDAIIQSDPKWIADRKKAAEEAAKADSEIQGRKDVAHIQGGYSVQRAQIQAAAKASGQAKVQSILQITKGDPVKTISALVTQANLLLKEGKVDEANVLFEAANDPVLRGLQSNQQLNAGRLTVGPDGQLATTGGSAPIPQATPRGGGGSDFPVAPGAPAPAQPAALPPPPPGQVRVKAPDGKVGFIPQAQLQEALSSGYTQQ